jgi:hypothetical protein
VRYVCQISDAARLAEKKLPFGEQEERSQVCLLISKGDLLFVATSSFSLYFI